MEKTPSPYLNGAKSGVVNLRVEKKYAGAKSGVVDLKMGEKHTDASSSVKSKRAKPPGGIKQGHHSSVRSRNDFGVDIKPPRRSRQREEDGDGDGEGEWSAKNCVAWAMLGECLHNPSYMHAFCYFACAAVGQEARPTSTPTPTPVTIPTFPLGLYLSRGKGR